MKKFKKLDTKATSKRKKIAKRKLERQAARKVKVEV